jgi:hypothetical protein
MCPSIIPKAPLQPGDRAPNIVLQAIARDGKVAGKSRS